MDFISSISFPSDQLNISQICISWPFLSSLLGGFASVCCCTHPKVMIKMVKKRSTDQIFIWKRNTTYKIHTLVNYGNCKYFFKIMKNVGHISEQDSKYSQGGQLSVWFCAFGPLFIHRMEFLTRNMGLKFLCRKRGPTTPNVIQTWPSRRYRDLKC